ncbi:phosphoheptose isomerase [candidate division KSB3 bacterium]|uniref:Phosphoheptose isomerase n=1 Tax=candidate division KSB3 bacterium TaxID=2044937 RepID=A0A2G6E7E1_9BACT|nr:MAG: phosphoheptose isomerase [candidate division KSB3 bacterium]PIE30273.1 MAG: phosphoheptose isomerase [candidate division KSB3 bacterium]
MILDPEVQQLVDEVWSRYDAEKNMLEQTLEEHKFFSEIFGSFLGVFSVLKTRFEAGGRLFLCGNGGSCADCIHIAGELMKTFKLPRPLSVARKACFAGLEFEEQLTAYLQEGLPCHVLGLNPGLASAIQNDNTFSGLQYAQELYGQGKAGDVLLGISTSGNALNVRYAASVAKALGMTVIALTGSGGGELAKHADRAIRVPETETYKVQEQHLIVYHTLCMWLELRFFAAPD